MTATTTIGPVPGRPGQLCPLSRFELIARFLEAIRWRGVGQGILTSQCRRKHRGVDSDAGGGEDSVGDHGGGGAGGAEFAAAQHPLE